MIKLPNKSRLLLWIALLLTGGFFAVSFAAYIASTDAVRRGIVTQELPLTSDNIYSEIQKDLLRPIFVSSVMAQDTFLRDWAIAGEKDVRAITRYLAEIKNRYKTVTSFFISEKTRIYYHAAGILKTVREDEPRDAWYFRVRKMAEPFETNVDPDLANRDTMTIFINYRVFDFAGNYIGTTGVGLTVDSVRRLIENYQQRFKRRIYFVDANGMIVLKGRTAALDAVNIRDVPGLAPLAERILKSDAEGSLLEYQSEEGTQLLNTRFIPELGWHLVVEQGIAASLRPLRTALFGNLAVATVVTLIVLFLASLTVARYQRRLEEMATTDKLTGLLNRQALDLIFHQAILDQKRDATPLSAILLDFDHFKSINDRFGHLAGDRTIRLAAEKVKGAIRESDVAGRWGGEEFLVVAKHCNLAQAHSLAEKIREAIAGEDYGLPDDERLTASFGIAEYKTGDTEIAMLARADAALYRAKAEGRDRVATERIPAA